jgi:hypothetical protein
MQCDMCQEPAEGQCERCGKHFCGTHLQAMNQDELYCKDCVAKVMTCLKNGYEWGEWHSTSTCE